MGERLILTTMRNEGPFILEWVAWYLMLGFDHIVIAHNDCTDHSPDLIDALARTGLVTALPYSPPKGFPAKRVAWPMLKAHPRVKAAEWVFLIDVDEFLVIHSGHGLLDDLLADFDMARCHGITVNWKCFGDGGRTDWSDGLVHRQFTRAAHRTSPPNAFFKTLIRWPNEFRRFGAHAPKGWKGSTPWGEGQNRLWRSNGKQMQRYHPETNALQATSAQWVSHEGAQLNHYASRTYESFALKKGVPSSVAGVNRYTETFFRNKNRNETVDRSALKYADFFDAVHADLCALPSVMRLHHLCCANYVERLGQANGFDPKADPRWHAHMRLAQTAEN